MFHFRDETSLPPKNCTSLPGLASSTVVNDSRWHGTDVALSFTACRWTRRFCSLRIFAVPQAPARGALCFMRKAPEGSSRKERGQASGPWHHPRGCGSQAGQTNDTATAPVGAGPWHGRKWSPEAKNGHVGCQKGRLDGHTESDPREKTIPCAHMEPFSTFKSLLLLL